MDCGPWTVDHGLWTVDFGQWIMDCGVWTVDYGLCYNMKIFTLNNCRLFMLFITRFIFTKL